MEMSLSCRQARNLPAVAVGPFAKANCERNVYNVAPGCSEFYVGMLEQVEGVDVWGKNLGNDVIAEGGVIRHLHCSDNVRVLNFHGVLVFIGGQFIDGSGGKATGAEVHPRVWIQFCFEEGIHDVWKKPGRKTLLGLWGQRIGEASDPDGCADQFAADGDAALDSLGGGWGRRPFSHSLSWSGRSGFEDTTSGGGPRRVRFNEGEESRPIEPRRSCCEAVTGEANEGGKSKGGGKGKPADLPKGMSSGRGNGNAEGKGTKRQARLWALCAQVIGQANSSRASVATMEVTRALWLRLVTCARRSWRRL